MRQLYKDAKTWRRRRDLNEFLTQLALNVAYRDAPDRSTVLSWIQRIREDLEASDPVRECIKRLIELRDPDEVGAFGASAEATGGGAHGQRS